MIGGFCVFSHRHVRGIVRNKRLGHRRLRQSPVFLVASLGSALPGNLADQGLKLSNNDIGIVIAGRVRIRFRGGVVLNGVRIHRLDAKGPFQLHLLTVVFAIKRCRQTRARLIQRESRLSRRGDDPGIAAHLGKSRIGGLG